ncbi:MFS transporter [Alteromonas gracilis]
MGNVLVESLVEGIKMLANQAGTGTQEDVSTNANLGALLSVMCGALALVVGAASSLSLALPDLAKRTGATQTELTWVVNSYALVFAGLLLPVGFAADRYGRRLFLVVGLLVFGLASLGSSYVTDPAVIIGLRGLAGVGAAAVMPATLSVLVDAFPEERRAMAVSVWAGVSGAGAMIGIVVAGVLLEAFSWSSVQLAYGAGGLAAAVASYAVVPVSRHTDLPQDVLGGLLSAGGLGGVVYGVIEGPERGWTDPATIGGLVLGGALLVAFVVHELRTPEPMLDVRLFSRRGVSAGSLLIFVQFFAAFGFFFLAPQWLQYVRDLSPLESAMWLLPMAVGIAPASRFGPPLLLRLGARPVATSGMALMALCYALFAFQADGEQPMWVFASTLVVFGGAFGLAITPGTSLIIDGLPEDRRTLSAAVNDVTREVGGALGGAVAASVLLAVYQDRLSPATTGLPDPAAAAARDGLTQALEVSARLGGDGQALASSALSSFSDGYGAALWLAAAVMLVGALVCAILTPRRRDSGSEDQRGRATAAVGRE